MVNETLARALWPGQNPLDQIVIGEGGSNPGRRVVGVVADVRHRALEQESGNELYLPTRQRDESGPVYLVVRTTLPPAALASTIRTALRLITPDLSGTEFKTIQQLVDKAVSPPSLCRPPARRLLGICADSRGARNLCGHFVFSQSAYRRTRHSHGARRVCPALATANRASDSQARWPWNASWQCGRLDLCTNPRQSPLRRHVQRPSNFCRDAARTYNRCRTRRLFPIPSRLTNRTHGSPARKLDWRLPGWKPRLGATQSWSASFKSPTSGTWLIDLAAQKR
jgi:hypothetical protein